MASTPSKPSSESADRTVRESHIPVPGGNPGANAGVAGSAAGSSASGTPSIHTHDTLAPADSSVDDQVEKIAQRWQDLHDEGKSAAIEELCGNDPRLAGRVREFLAKVGKLEAILATQAPSADTLRGSYQSKDGMLAPAQQPDELGRLGGFRILKLIGQGGMGKVYLAEDIQLKRRVAVKVLLKGGDTRFLREAQTLAKVEHDHIITIYFIGEDKDRGTQYIAMPYLQGETLEKRLKTLMRLPLPESIRIGKQIASGLAAAHKVGIIHRDIKPSNIWLEAETDRVKILDFGLARETEACTMLTQEGSVIGTPAFMAPEQAAGTPVDAKADLFSLGCCLYQMISGVSPFARKDVLSTLRALELETPELPTIRYPETPGPLSDLAMKLLSKKPEDRPASAQAVLDALTAIEKGLESGLPNMSIDAVSPTRVMPAREKSRGNGSLVPIITGVVVLGLLIAGLAIAWPRIAGTQGDPLVKADPKGNDKDILVNPIKGDGKIDAKVNGKNDKTHTIELPNVDLPDVKQADFKIDVRIPNARKDGNGVMQLVDGDPLKIEIVTDQSAYVGVWYEGDDGQVKQLFPNEFDRDHFFQAGKTYEIPKKNYEINVTSSTKLEKVRVIASTKEWKWDPRKAHDGYQYFRNMKEFEQDRGVFMKANPNNPAQISAQSLPLFVAPEKDKK